VYAHLLDAVSSALPEVSVSDRAEVLRLVQEGPPDESVGLEPFAPPEVMPMGARP
jgi:nitrate reductase delta subunit